MAKAKAEVFLNRIWGTYGKGRHNYNYIAWFESSGDWQKKGGFAQLAIAPGEKVVLPVRENVYFAPVSFHSPRRSRETALPCRWLYADLDECDPEQLALPPTLLWQTSQDRWQCMWKLTKPLKPDLHEKLNQRMTRLHDADPGGWGLSKVLRVPYTESTKHGGRWRIYLTEYQNFYTPQQIVDAVREVKVTTKLKAKGNDDFPVPDVSADVLLRKYADSLSGDARALLKRRSVRGQDRSRVLFRLECELLAAGATKAEVFLILRYNVWNKFKNSPKRLKADITRAAAHVEASNGDEEAAPKKKRKRQSSIQTGLVLENFDDLLTSKPVTQTWLVEGVWGDTAHGVIAGEAKTYKTLLALDLSVAVASGTKFLGKYEVPVQGPVIFLQEENSKHLIQDRVWKLVNMREGLTSDGRAERNGHVTLPQVAELPLKFGNHLGFKLTEQEDFDWLVEQVSIVKPKLVVLDPFYLMAPGVNENSASEVGQVLAPLLKLKQKFDTGVVLIHHFNKAAANPEHHRHKRDRISGTSTFQRWWESAMYLERGDEPQSVLMSSDHRAAVSTGAVKVEVEMGPLGDDHCVFTVTEGVDTVDKIEQGLKDLVESENGIKLIDAARLLDISKDRTLRVAQKMGFGIEESSMGRRGRPSIRLFDPNVDEK